MKKIFNIVTILVAAISIIGCNKIEQEIDENAWIYDETKSVPVRFATSSSSQTKAIKSGLISGTVMNDLDIGIIAVADRDRDSVSVVWSPELDNSIFMDNVKVTTTRAGEIVFSPKVYYPFSSQYAYNFYSYYPYTNHRGESAVYDTENGYYSITYTIGDTDILWAKSQAQTYNGIQGFNAVYSRAIAVDNKDEYLPRLDYEHKMTALVFNVVGKQENIVDYDVKVTQVSMLNIPTSASLIVADSLDEREGELILSELGTYTREVNTSVGTVSSEICTMIVPSDTSYTVKLRLSVAGANESFVELSIGGENHNYLPGYIYNFTVSINNPEEVTIFETSLQEWKPGSNPVESTEI